MRPNRTVLVSAALVTFAAGLIWWLGARASAAMPPPPTAPAIATRGPTATMADVAKAPAADSQRTPAGVETAPSGTLLVRGRCLAAADDTLLRGVDVRATAIAGDDDGAPGEQAAASLARVDSGPDGRFELRLSSPEDMGLRVDLVAAGCARMTAVRRASTSGDVWDIGDVHFVGEARVRGDVVDSTGSPVAEAVVTLAMVRLDRPAARFRELHRAPTDSRGAFVFDEPIAAGEWFVRVGGTGLQRSAPTTVVAAGGDHVLRVEVERPDPALAITGNVVDGNGVAVAGVDLTASGDGAMGGAVSRVDGTFTIHRGMPVQDTGRTGVTLSASSAAHDCLQPAAGTRLRWGQRDVQVVMAPLTHVVVRTVDATGATVPGRVVAARLRPANDVLIDLAKGSMRDDPDGAVRFMALRAGAYVAWSRPHDHRLALVGPVQFTVPRGEELRIVAVSPVLVEVRVSAGREPVAGSTVELLVTPSTRAVDPGAPALLVDVTRPEVLRGQSQLAQARAQTAAEGRVSLPVAPGRYLLRVRGAGHLPFHRELDVAPGMAAVEVVATTAAVLHGRLEPVEAVAAMWAASDDPGRSMLVTARRPGTSVDIASAPVARDGTFVLGPLPGGSLDVFWGAWIEATSVHAGRVPLRIGAVDAPSAGGAIEGTFAIGDLLPGSVEGRVVLDGAPLRKAELFMRTAMRSLGVRVNADEDGRFTARVAPGDYHAALALPAQPGPGHVILPVPGRWTVRSGMTTMAAIDARVRTLRLTLRDAAGALLTDTRVRLDGPAGYARPGFLATDENGVVVVTPAPYGPFGLLVGGGPNEQRFGPVEMPEATSEHSIELRGTR